MKKLLFLLCVLGLNGCHSMQQIKTDIYINSQSELIFSGSINRKSVNKAIELLNTSSMPIKTIVVNSHGGVIKQGIKLGYEIFKRKLDIVIDGICVSSCANYLLPAANNKRITLNSWLGFHGGAFQKKWSHSDKFDLFLCHDLIQTRLIEYDFYKKIGVNFQMNIAGQLSPFVDQRTEKTEWTYQPKDFAFFGVKNIHFEDHQNVSNADVLHLSDDLISYLNNERDNNLDGGVSPNPRFFSSAVRITIAS